MRENPRPARSAGRLADELRAVEAELTGRQPETEIEPSLTRMHALMELLGQPQSSYPTIHVTGTNGKTSTSRMIERLLMALGLRTGRYTSPHVRDMTERISLDGEPITARGFVDTYAGLAPLVGEVDSTQPLTMSFFEVVTAMAYAAFAKEAVDVAVIEVGMGGTWDATNVIDAAVSVITPVALDHTDMLGATTGEIAAEKSGVVKSGRTAVVARQVPDAADRIAGRAADVGATLLKEGEAFGVLRREPVPGGQRLTLQGRGGRYDDVFLPLYGAHQAQNAACALAAVEAFCGVGRDGDETLDIDRVRSAFAGASSPGRLELVGRDPVVLLDAAHNPAGARATAEGLREAFGSTTLIGVLAPSADKDVRGVLLALEPVLSEVVATENSSPRAMPAADVAALAREVFGADRVRVVPDLGEAVDAAAATARKAGAPGAAGVLVTGSVVTVGEAGLLLRGGRS
ncbi:bifunctional folylpolyglutamate synthase/dihydrofolate synthase [Streptomyces fuscigenes]|uniref:bifunctional folylpolyglutamate synthase/dihydrofolate synthase n=1 Tax=Streptomyces fuscigenes TaxID=1528880 RepID=UPI001F3D02A2|nr:folylpolyglutamate synthase/dihydrofolate synthase family protein [Streptomyces fuscigenes]MCF3963566.1 bifunctional folylpolyglutamate synthase/dihydrofolate synthase [Streptomyces fuscigenes]